MTVEDLRRKLLHFADDAEVVLSRDPEGNGYSTIGGEIRGWYKPERRCYGVGEFLTDEDIADAQTSRDGMVEAVCLFPNN